MYVDQKCILKFELKCDNYLREETIKKWEVLPAKNYSREETIPGNTVSTTLSLIDLISLKVC